MPDEQWFLIRDERSHGPFSTEEVNQLLLSKEITEKTLVWREGQDQWASVEKVLPESTRPQPPSLHFSELSLKPAFPSSDGAIPQQRPMEYAQRWRETSPMPWRRYFARMLDSVVHGAIVFFAAGVMLYVLAPDAAEKSFRTISSYRVLDGLLTALFALPLNALFIGFTGGTFGKWLFGVRVLDMQGSPIGFLRALHREGAVFVRGMGCAIPIVTLCTCVAGYNRLKGTGAASWDREMNLEVVHRTAGIRQTAFFCIGILALITAFVGLQALG